jgi:hypothetical protein
LIERKNAIYEGAGARSVEQFQHVPPSSAAFDIRVCADSDPPYAKPPKQQRSCVEAGDWPRQASNDTDVTLVAQSIQQFRKELSPDVVYSEVDAPWRQEAFH